MKNQTACFTGHREIPFFQKRRLKAKVKSAITDAIRNGYRYFGAGGALGFDMLAAQTVLELKADYPDIKLILVLPCLNQTRGWAQEDVKEYERIKAAADKVRDICKVWPMFQEMPSISGGFQLSCLQSRPPTASRIVVYSAFFASC